MIINTIQNMDRYSKLNTHFAKAFAFIKEAGNLGPGRRVVDAHLTAIVIEEKKEKKKLVLEAHKKHIDILYIMEGTAGMGWKALKDCTKAEEYNEKDDYTLFSENPEVTMTMPKGTCAIFFPEDAHCSLSNSPAKKLVLKVRVA